MIWFIGIAIILMGYMLRYIPIGITHPVPVLLAYWIVILPFKYLLLRSMDVPFGVPLHVVNLGGMYLFWFLFSTVLVHAFFSVVKTGFPLIEMQPRIGLLIPTLILMASVIAIFSSMYGIGAITNSLKVHIFASTGIAAYFEIFFEFCAIITVVQLAQSRSHWGVSAFLLLLICYFVLLARAGMLIVIGSVYVGYLCMVRRIVPVKTIVAILIVLMPLALLQGELRQSGGFTTKAISQISRRLGTADASKVVAQSFSARVDQIEAFGSFSDALDTGTVSTDPISPLYIFSQILPRSVWPDKPRMFNDQITSYVSPRISTIHTVRNFIGPAELMYAYGPILGIILTAIVYGYLFAVFDRYYLFSLERPYAYLFITVVPVIYLGIASQSGLLNSGALLQLFIYLFLLAGISKIRVIKSTLHVPQAVAD